MDGMVPRNVTIGSFRVLQPALGSSGTKPSLRPIVDSDGAKQQCPLYTQSGHIPETPLQPVEHRGRATPSVGNCGVNIEPRTANLIVHSVKNLEGL